MLSAVLPLWRLPDNRIQAARQAGNAAKQCGIHAYLELIYSQTLFVRNPSERKRPVAPD